MTIARITEFARKWTSSLWQRVVLFGVAYFICAWIGTYLSRSGAFVSFWMPAGLALAVLLMNKTRDWPWLLLAIFTAGFLFDFFHGARPAVGFLFCCANVVESFTGAWLVRTFVGECPRLKTLREFIGLMAFGAVFNSALGGLIGAATMVHFGISPSFVLSWRIWWCSGVMAVLILTPFILVWFDSPDECRNVFNSRGKIVEAILLFAGITVATWYLLNWQKGIMSPDKSTVIPFLLWAGLRFGAHGATAVCLYFSLVLSFFTTQFSYGLTPALVASGEFVIVLQMVLVMAVLISLIPAIVLCERDRTMAKLRESEERYRNLNSASFEGIAITENGRFVDVNEQMLGMFGYEREEMIGREVIELVAPESRSIVAESIRKGREENYEHWLLRKDGSSFIAEARAKMMRVEGRTLRMTALRDITDAKRAEEALRESEKRFRSYFELASVGFSITSRDMRIIAVNDEYCRILGYSREELLKKTWAELTCPDDMPANESLFEQAVAGKLDAYTINKRLVRKDGQVINTTVSARCVRRPDGSPDYFVSLLLDITEREQAIEREQRARAEYTLQLIASQEAERERIAGELHDSLGQSLSLVKNHAQLVLMQKRLAADTRKEIETISETTSAAIAEMRRISQDLHPYQLDHLGLTGALTSLIESVGNAGGIAFEKKLDMVDDVFSPHMAANLYRIVQEGVNNILKHSHAKSARITLERDLHEIRLFIEDGGRGFNPDDKGKGMGLRNIAERARIIGGRLKVDSTLGKGVRVEIIIPISPGPE